MAHDVLKGRWLARWEEYRRARLLCPLNRGGTAGSGRNRDGVRPMIPDVKAQGKHPRKATRVKAQLGEAPASGETGIVKRVRIEVEREVAAWSARPAVIVVEPDAELRPVVAAAARRGAGQVPVIVGGSEREGMEVVGSRPAVLLWLGDDAEIDPARLVGLAVRRSPIAVVVLRLASALSEGRAAGACPVAFQGPAETLVDHLAGLVALAVGSWLPKLDTHAQELMRERLARQVAGADLHVIGGRPAVEPESRQGSERDVLRNLYLRRLLDHDLVVSDAAASLGLGRRMFYRRCQDLGVDVPALRRRRRA